MAQELLTTYTRNQPVWYYETRESKPVAGFFVKENRRGITIELADNNQKQTSYACITPREVVTVDA